MLWFFQLFAPAHAFQSSVCSITFIRYYLAKDIENGGWVLGKASRRYFVRTTSGVLRRIDGRTAATVLVAYCCVISCGWAVSGVIVHSASATVHASHRATFQSLKFVLINTSLYFTHNLEPVVYALCYVFAVCVFHVFLFCFESVRAFVFCFLQLFRCPQWLPDVRRVPVVHLACVACVFSLRVGFPGFFRCGTCVPITYESDRVCP